MPDPDGGGFVIGGNPNWRETAYALLTGRESLHGPSRPWPPGFPVETGRVGSLVLPRERTPPGAARGFRCRPVILKNTSDTDPYADTVLYPKARHRAERRSEEAVVITERLTRQQSRQITRERILRSAAGLFASQGVSGTSVEQIVEAAGYTRGAFYGNFEGKHELVQALLEERTRHELAEVRAMGTGAGTFEETLDRLRSWHRRRDENLVGWLALRTELWLYALRDPELLPGLAERELRSREAIARSLEQGFTERGITVPVPVEHLALIVHALDDGLSIQRVLAPADSGPDSVVDAVELLLASWAALARTVEPPREGPAS
ncbi:TetR/AcrR family transcriptional regulator [Streptomyces sp. NPDC058195]|uniref:TetR/AcrR family transcriptional regulator n=1 Tax=Streptomyces sp. NPDC058195 TaxID=3346375 RepID=UPI0036E878CC